MLFELSYLSSNFVLTLGYLSPASNNPALDDNSYYNVDNLHLSPINYYFSCHNFSFPTVLLFQRKSALKTDRSFVNIKSFAGQVADFSYFVFNVHIKSNQINHSLKLTFSNQKITTVKDGLSNARPMLKRTSQDEVSWTVTCLQSHKASLSRHLVNYYFF